MAGSHLPGARPIAVAIVACWTISLSQAISSRATTVPAGFVVSNAFPTATFTTPVQVVFVPGGRRLVVEKDGQIWTITSAGNQLPEPFLDIRNRVLANGDRGLLGVALDPDFTQNRWVYCLYTVDPDSNGVDTEIGTWARLARYQVSLADTNVIDTTSVEVLIGTTWSNGIPFPSSDLTHTIGTLRFGRDKTLLVGSGDAAHYSGTDRGGLDAPSFAPGKLDPAEDLGAFRAQSLNSMCGKLLRVDKETGRGLPSNPYWDGNGTSARSRVWLYGLRNPFRFGIRPGSGSTDPADGRPGTLFVADVGWNTWEELDVARGGGANLGWPCVEGPEQNSAYLAEKKPPGIACATYSSSIDPTEPTLPALWWHHSTASRSSPAGVTGHSIIAGAFYNGTNYPAAYRGRLFLADFSTAWIRYADVDDNDNIIALHDFINNGAASPGDVEADPETGDIFYVSIFSNIVQRIRYVTGNRDPVAGATLTPLYGASPLTVTADATGSFDPDNDALTFLWRFGDGDSATSALATHVYTAEGPHTVELEVRDGRGGLDRRAFGTIAGQVPPPGQIVLPRERGLFAAGDTVALQAVTVDPAGGPASYRWDVDLIHADHIHPSQLVLFGATARYLFPLGNDVERNGHRIRLAVTQGAITIRDTVEIWPDRNARLTALTSDSRSPDSDHGFTLTGMVHSTGRLGTHAFHWQVRDGDQVLSDHLYEGILPAGDSLAFAASVGPLPPGIHPLSFVVDPSDAMLESDETDNSLPLTLVVRGPRDAFAVWHADSADGSGPRPSGSAAGPWRDLINGYDGTLSGFAGGVDGWQGDGSAASPNRLEFDGLDDRVVLAPAGAVSELAAPLATSAEIWFRTGDDVARPQTLLDWVEEYGLPWAGVSVGIAEGRLRVDLSPWTVLAPLPPRTWHQVVVAKGVDSVRVWLDQRRVWSGGFSNLGAQQSPLLLGASTHAGATAVTELFGGAIALVRLYRTELLEADVRLAFARDSAAYLPGPGAAPQRLLVFAADSAASGTAPLVPGTASPWSDLGAGGHDGVLIGFTTPSDSSGWQGDGGALSPWRLEFDGVDDRVVVAPASVPELQSPAAASAAVWFRTGADVARAQSLLEWRSDTSADAAGMRVGLAAGRLTVDGAITAAGPVLSPGSWHNTVVALGAVSRLVLLDGHVVLDDFSPRLAGQHTALTFGGPAGGGGGAFRGALARAEVWSGALDSVGAQALYAAQAVLFHHEVGGPAAGPALSAAAPLAAIPIAFDRSQTGPIEGYSVRLRLSPELALNGAGFECGNALGEAGTTFFHVQNLGDGLYQVDEAALGGSAYDPGTQPLFRVCVSATVPAGAASISVLSVRVRDALNRMVAADPGGPTLLRIDETPPVPIADLAAQGAPLRGETTDLRHVRLTFTAPADAESVHVYRAPFGNYPEYDDPPAAGLIPAAPAYPPGAPWQLVPARFSGRTDLPPARDAWHYVAFAWDSSGNRSPASNITSGVVDYLLGDFTGGPGRGDGAVTQPDLDSLLAHYGQRPPSGDPRAALDVGPTLDSTRTGRPLTDDALDFEDLMEVALDWSAANLPPVLPAGLDIIALDASTNPAFGDTFQVGLQFTGSGRLHGLSARLAYDPLQYVPLHVMPGPLVGTQALPVVIASSAPGGIDFALLGSGPGFAGTGLLGIVTFRRIGEGTGGIGFSRLVARDAADHAAAVQTGLPITGVEPGLASATLAFERVSAEPARGAAEFALTLPARAALRIKAYDVQGRCVRTVRDGVLPSGRHRVAWDGRDDRGSPVAPGVYLVRLQTQGREFIRRVTLLR